jgi:hypothetical protein
MSGSGHGPSIPTPVLRRAGRTVAAISLAALVLGLFAPLAAGAQQRGQMRRIGVLMGFAESDPQGRARVEAFRKGLQTLGWAEGRNVRIDIRWATTSDAPAMQRAAKELIALQPDLILSHNTPHYDFAATHAHHPDRFRGRFGSDRQRFRCELSAAWRQRHRVYQH